MQGGARAILQQGTSIGGTEQHSLDRDLQAALALQPADDPVPGSIQEIKTFLEDDRRKLPALREPRDVLHKGAFNSCAGWNTI